MTTQRYRQLAESTEEDRFGPKDGPTKARDTIDHLLGYMTWRDTRSAVLLFIRDRNVSDVMTAAVQTFEGHPNFKRHCRNTSDERYDFVFHANGDTTKEVAIAVLPFVIPGQ